MQIFAIESHDAWPKKARGMATNGPEYSAKLNAVMDAVRRKDAFRSKGVGEIVAAVVSQDETMSFWLHTKDGKVERLFRLTNPHYTVDPGDHVWDSIKMHLESLVEMSQEKVNQHVAALTKAVNARDRLNKLLS